MRCPKCGCQEDKVIDSRASREGATIRRRRECAACNHRFTTYEEVEHEGLMVLKRDGRHEEFTREKLLSGIRKACQKSLRRSPPSSRRKCPVNSLAPW
jgi:transcriptional repressor NrdR